MNKILQREIALVSKSFPASFFVAPAGFNLT